VDGWGDLIGRLIEVVTDAATEGAEAGVFPWGSPGREGGAQGEPSATATYDRVLTGARRDLNINDR
jgi:hypothetical protein